MNKMYLTLIICTYKRPISLKDLLESVGNCDLKPNTILIIDGSPDDNTKDSISNTNFDDLQIEYYKVPPEHRGLTRQRNFGVAQLPSETEIVAFLDDDIKVECDFFEKLIETYQIYPDAIGVGGLDLKDNGYFTKRGHHNYSRFNYYEIDGWVIRESLRSKARKVFGLMTNLQPGLIPEYSHGRSQLPPNGKIYEVEHLMGGIASYKRELFEKIQFSNYFSGYSLYEDFDFSVRALKHGKLFVNTNAKVWHYHAQSGRPDYYKYGGMVIRNGWYVWRVRFPSPHFKAKLKWHAITLLLAQIRLANTIIGPDRKNAFLDYLGRMTAWAGVCVKPPVIQNYQ